VVLQRRVRPGRLQGLPLSLSLDGVYAALNGGASLTRTELLDGDAAEGTTYFYRITGLDTQGNESA
jgi:hypothetical protein